MAGNGGGQQRRRREQEVPPAEGDGWTPEPEGTRSPSRANGAASSAAAGGYRGLDSGLAKAAPIADDLTQSNYRSFRKRLELFALQCRRRSKDAEVEGALLVVSLLKNLAWDAASEQLDLNDIERNTEPFKPVLKLLDGLYQYEEEIEVPVRCEDFFQLFMRGRGEEMQAYLIRHKTQLKKLREIGIDIPPLLAGWHLLTRSGVPKWTHIQI